jgi:hypothetical protein
MWSTVNEDSRGKRREWFAPLIKINVFRNKSEHGDAESEAFGASAQSTNSSLFELSMNKAASR